MAASDRPRNALLVIDIQDSFKALPRWEHRNNPAFESNVTRLIAAFRSADAPIFYFLHGDCDEHFSVSSPHYRLMDFLTPRPDEAILHKTSRNCFTTTNLSQRLVRMGVGRVTISGIQTEQCCETTARVAADLGFEVDFVTEATLTFPIPRLLQSGGEELGTDAVVERTEYALRRRFARICTVDEALAETGVRAIA
ncbi:MAG TPA: isochorismatase family protein [Candidatus Baltobacteraceae bacterium]|nr:isochorismatase family protein [Candidatus Baltobacteraceae bacterium]